MNKPMDDKKIRDAALEAGLDYESRDTLYRFAAILTAAKDAEIAKLVKRLTLMQDYYECKMDTSKRFSNMEAEIAKLNEVIAGLVGHIRHHEECPSHPSKLPPPNCPCPCGASESLAAAAPFLPAPKKEAK